MIINLRTLSAAAIMAAMLPFAAKADMPGNHPAYLHALTDLRSAYWLIESRGGDARVREHDRGALQEIVAAINEIKGASIDDGKDIHDHPPMDAPKNYPGAALHRADELLHKTHDDVKRKEDDPRAREMQHRALIHIDEAIRNVEAGIHDVEMNR